MVLAYLRGRRRSALESRGRDTKHLSRESDEADRRRRLLLLLLLLGDDDERAIFERIDPQSIALATLLWSGIEKKLAATVDGLAPTVGRATIQMRDAFESAGVMPASNGAASVITGAAVIREYESGRADAYRQPNALPNLWGWTWRTVGDDRVCPICIPLEGMTAPVNDPAWTALEPPIHANCRCTRLPVWGEGKTIQPAASDEQMQKILATRRKFLSDFFGER